MHCQENGWGNESCESVSVINFTYVFLYSMFFDSIFLMAYKQVFLLLHFQILNMSKFKYREEIRQADCPAGKAPPYPGKKNKNNKGGSELSHSDFVDNVIAEWVKHFENSEKYEGAPWGQKIKYLVWYLEPLKVSRSVAKSKLIAVETMLAEEAQKTELTDSQNALCTDMDIDRAGDGEQTRSDRSRWEKFKEVEQVLKLADDELFEGDRVVPQEVKQAIRYKQREKQYYLAKSDDDLFEKSHNLSTYVTNSDEYKERQQQYVTSYMEDNFHQSSSQDILEKSSQTPSCIQNSDLYKALISHLSFEEKSERLVWKNIKDSLTELQKTPDGKKDARKVIAAVSHPVFGDPGLGLNWRQKQEAKQIKENLLTGKAATLKLPEKAARKIYPDSVEAIASNHWRENTIPEPAKHTGRAVIDGAETVPTRYQDKTDRECYENFVEECKEKVKANMSKVSRDLILKLASRPNTMDKRRRLEYAESLPDKFPSLNWYIAQRPPETKPLCDHTTGLCKVCEAAKQNFANIVNTAKRLCECGTTSCPRWFCVCPIAEEGDDETLCTCTG